MFYKIEGAAETWIHLRFTYKQATEIASTTLAAVKRKAEVQRPGFSGINFLGTDKKKMKI